MKPVVSVVIPTLNRPLLVGRAVRSALEQTFERIEVLVVIDGPDEATRVVLAHIYDPRLRILELPVSQGGSSARNTGVREAKGEWIAFLDDDDEWLPQKLEKQIEVAHNSSHIFPVVASRVIARTPKGDFVWPRKLPPVDGVISEYLLARNSLFKGEALILCSTLFVKRKLLLQKPLNQKLIKHQDTEWILVVSNLENVKIEFAEEPLTIWNTEEERHTVSSQNNWQFSIDWIHGIKQLVTPRAYASFVLIQVSAEARQQGDWQAFFPLFWKALQFGKPSPIDFLLHLGIWLIPRKSRRWLRVSLSKKHKILKHI